MKTKTLQIDFQEANGPEELNSSDNLLLQQATEASFSAYAPYSHFHVGAAVLLENGEIIKGNNQENAAYPSSLCAERVALFAAAAKFPKTAVKAIAITAHSATNQIDSPVTPCGACRQVMIEFENLAGSPIKVIMRGQTGKILLSESVKNLIPLSFNGEHLKNK